jgi:hypothetical protein
MFLVVKGACAVLEGSAFHSGGELRHAPEGIAYFFVNMG